MLAKPAVHRSTPRNDKLNNEFEIPLTLSLSLVLSERVKSVADPFRHFVMDLETCKTKATLFFETSRSAWPNDAPSHARKLESSIASLLRAKNLHV